MSELLEKVPPERCFYHCLLVFDFIQISAHHHSPQVTASDPQCAHAHLLEAELHLERRQYAAALFSARNAHALHRSVRSYRSLHGTVRSLPTR
jgi:hypothetical protein